MKGYIRSMQEAIYYLLSIGCRRENLIICFSRIIEHDIVDEFYKNDLFLPQLNPTSFKERINDLRSADKFEGVQINRDWPYNEIVVYDKKQVYINDAFIAKIKIINDTLYLETIKMTHKPINSQNDKQ